MKCTLCGDEFDKLKTVGQHKYCDECYDLEEEERKKLITTIIQLFHIDKPTGFMFMQMKRFKEDNGWYYRNMRLTLHYVVKVLNFRLDPKYGLSPIKYHHDDMLAYYKKMNNKVKKGKTIEYKTKEVITQAPALVNKDYKKHKMKDLSQYGKGE